MALTKEFWLIKSKSKTKSLLTGSETVAILDLGLHGYADSFFGPNEIEKASFGLPLICRLDTETGLVQTQIVTDPMERYSGVDYSYTSSNSQASKKHWVEFAKFANSRRAIKGAKILEIGSNDGFLLSQFLGEAIQLTGVDASPYMCDLATTVGIPTFKGIFGDDEDLSIMLKDRSNSYDLIIANNVLNHANNPVSFVKSVANLLSRDGEFIFEVPYWLETIRSLHFDQIYHEHVTYLTVSSAEKLLEMAGLHISSVEIVDYHGGSIRISAGHTKSFLPVPSLLQYKKAEEIEDLRNPLRYEKYFRDISRKKDCFLSRLEKLSLEQGNVVFGIGAAAKANTLLTFYGLNNDKIAFILDASIHKQGKITPMTKIPIYPDSHLLDQSGGLGIILAWNIGDAIKTRIYEINPRVEVIGV
jgi:SAM-dependent methyltransferase